MAEWDGLENRCAGNCTEGSNPSLSAEAVGSYQLIVTVNRVCLRLIVCALNVSYYNRGTRSKFMHRIFE